MEGSDSDRRRLNVEPEAASGAVASVASSSARPTGTRSSSRVASASSTGNKRQRQTTLATVAVPRGEDVTVLAGAKPSSGSGSASAVRSGAPGRKKDWIHEHWVPVDKGKYKDDDPAADSQMYRDNALMQCLHCHKQRRYQPSTKFKDHLITACTAFADSDSWADPDITTWHCSWTHDRPERCS